MNHLHVDVSQKNYFEFHWLYERLIKELQQQVQQATGMVGLDQVFKERE